MAVAFVNNIFYRNDSTNCSLFYIKKINDLKNKLSKELTEKITAQKEINEINDKLEIKVNERTRALLNSNLILEKEIIHRRKAEKKLRENELKYKLLFNNSPLGIISFSNKLKVTQVNTKFSQLFNINSKQMENFDLTTISNSSLTLAFKEAIIGNAGSYEGYYTSTINNNSAIVSVKTTPIYGEDGLISGGIATVENISERKEFELALINAKEKAEKANMLKSEFLAQISHEIRTPINAVLSFSSLLKEEVSDLIDDDLKISFDVIENQGKRITRTIDLLVNVSEIHNKTYEPLKDNINLFEDIIQKVLKTYEPLAVKKGLKIETFNETKNNSIVADSYSIIQIFEQLLDNAVKYTDKGKIKISLLENNENVLAIIEDTGIGISEEYQHKIFELFSQEEQGYTRKYEGNGLGLSLVKGYCDINKIKLNIESKKQKGTKVTLTFIK
ncbi:MAG: PAS domain-containing sensor histidine kinase [bacterium]